MQKSERLLDLAAFLLRSPEPVAWREIQEQFPDDYGGQEGAAIRKFERDKAELLELGVPVRWAPGDDDRSAGYVIDRDEFYLPSLDLPPEDLALLYLAGSVALAHGAFPYGRDLAHAMNKLSFAARAPGASEAAGLAASRLSREDDGSEGGDGRSEAEPPAARALEALSAAIGARKRMHLVYAGAERPEVTARDVDPYGLYQSGGAWFLAGHCHLRGALRTFHVGRIQEFAVNPSAPRTPDFAVPEGFDLREVATRETWEFAKGPPVRCVVRLENPIAPEVRASFGPRAEVSDEPGGARVEVTATNPDALVRHVLSLGERAEILAPARLRAAARDALRALAARCAAP